MVVMGGTSEVEGDEGSLKGNEIETRRDARLVCVEEDERRSGVC